MTTAFDALRDALFAIVAQSALRDPHDDAQRLEQALSRAGYLIVPAGSVREIGQSSVCVGQHVLILDGLTSEQARDAADIVSRHEMHTQTTEAS